MANRTWNFIEKFSDEHDLQLYISQNGVSIKRTVQTASGKTITYRCSKYRKHPDCDFQIKATFNSEVEILVSTSNSHNHEHRATTTRAPSPVRHVVINAAAAGLSLTQTRRSVENQCKTRISNTQLTSLLNYHRALTVPDVYSADDFRSWCHEHSAILSDPSALHEPFVGKYYIESRDELFVFMTTRKLISTAPLSTLLQVDATFKLNWNELPVLVFGSSDGNRHFYPYGIAVIGTDEAASSYITLFQTIKEWVFNVTGLRYDIQYLLGDGAKGITAAQKFEFPNCRRASLLLYKWRSDPDLYIFSNYFEHTWLGELKYWYEGAAYGCPSTNNGLESLNSKIKQQYTLRSKLPLSKFLGTMQDMLRDWSNKTAEAAYQTFPHVNGETEKEGWKWINDLNKNSILHWYAHSYIVPSMKNKDYLSSLWLQEYSTLSWKDFDDFAKYLFAGRLVTLPMSCTCRSNLKTYVCKHAIGLSMHFGLYKMPDPSKYENLGKRRGRPKKAKSALSR